MARSWPIIHIIGLPGAGKTALANMLSQELDLPIFQIGTFREKFPLSIEGEADAWIALFRALSKRGWKSCIVETTGLNAREGFLHAAFPFSKIMTIKLNCQRRVLFSRIGRKKGHDRGADWLFSSQYGDKYEFVKKMFRHFKNLPADISIDTTRLNSRKVYGIILNKIKDFMPV
jgi:hypothetical protein